MKRLFQDKRQKWIYLAMIGFVTVLVLHFVPVYSKKGVIPGGSLFRSDDANSSTEIIRASLLFNIDAPEEFIEDSKKDKNTIGNPVIVKYYVL